MAAQIKTDIAIPNLTKSQVKDILRALDIRLHTTILFMSLHGFYTGVMAVSLWTIVQSKSRLHGRGTRFLIVVILLLYVFATVNVFGEWMSSIRSFITNGNNFWTEYMNYRSTPIYFLEGSIACLSTILADTTLIWRCWSVWGGSWRVVLVPIICTILGVGMSQNLPQYAGVIILWTHYYKLKSAKYSYSLKWT
ncbi:hypothetical protein IW261DRAFT_836222 [Armillaria novae-zelandiae]|uniref:Uncharacterized protein n=1 Tax=Armillaria novae-zelandiae TaxID=153914 RepID=A0AA39NTR5_9AGAR|nr:hypothetical protein IW261DRAFT_836222 [Armillaria novae-zelandiae]